MLSELVIIKWAVSEADGSGRVRNAGFGLGAFRVLGL